MRSSQYFRAQAQLYADIALLLSDPKAAESAVATAGSYLEQADELERVEQNALAHSKAIAS
jgi:hypothetical protein